MNDDSVSEVSSEGIRGKQIPWRDKEKGAKLLLCLFRLANAKGIYKEIKRYSKDFMRSEERWELFVEELFRQPEFAGITGSVRAVKTMFDQTIRERARFHGWLDINGGVTGNLSNEEGDLSGIDVEIKQILLYREEQRETEKFNTNLSKELDQNEVTIITNNLKKRSKAKSKDSSSSSGHSSTVSGSTRSTFSEFDNTYLNFFGVKKPKKRR